MPAAEPIDAHETRDVRSAAPDADPVAEGAVAYATCAGCGIACDDITVSVARDGRIEVGRACGSGREWFAARSGGALPPALVDGVPVPFDTAVDAAATLLRRARLPLVYGLGRATCEAQREAVAVAERLGAVIDGAGPVLDGDFATAAQTEGSITASLGDVRDRAGVVIAWRVDPVRRHPRLLERIGFDADARAAAGSDPGRLLVVVDEEPTATARRADMFVRVPRPHDLAAIWTLRAIARDAAWERGQVTALPIGDLERLVFHLRGHNTVAVLYGAPASGVAPGVVEAAALLGLVHDLNHVSHAVGLPLRREANAAGAEDVLAWRTGFPSAVSFAGGRPRANPGELDATGLLARREIDAALIVASDPLDHLPPLAADGLRAVPTVVVDSVPTATSAAAHIAIAPAAAGVYAEGTVHRTDGIPVPLPRAIASARPGDAEVLGRLNARIEALPAPAGIR